LGIKAVLTAAMEANIHYDHSMIPYHLVVNAQDASSFNLIEYFDQAIDFTRKSLRSTNLLIHCMVGVSRSATLTIAYFMA
jgi:protein-tyrosine phosphatase